MTLLNEDATYDNLLMHFGSEHLLKAGKGDIVLFAYSGHGSQEPAAAEFSRYYPEGMQETLVCYDSRIAGGLDMADKELAFLIEKIAMKGAHVVVLLDSCHSGSATRAAEDFTFGAAKQASERKTPRPYDSYLKGDLQKRFPNGEGLLLPVSRHIALAACDRREKAYELKNNRGAFCYYLTNILEETDGQISYADLFSRCRIQMAKFSDRQHPQFDTYGYFNGYDSFLGLGAAAMGTPVRMFFMDNHWQVNCGALHGLPVSSDKQSGFEIIRDGEVIGQAKTTMVGIEESNVRLEEEPAE